MPDEVLKEQAETALHGDPDMHVDVTVKNPIASLEGSFLTTRMQQMRNASPRNVLV